MWLNYKVFGEGFPIVILHGLFGSLDNWQTIARKLSSDFKVYTVDLRNHGRSPHSHEHSYQLMAADLKLFFEEQGLLKAHIIGHSMGGKLAMQFAILYPRLVDKLVVVDIAPKAYGRGHNEIFDALFSVDLDTVQSRKDADGQLMQKIPSIGVRQFLLKNLDRVEGNRFEWKPNLKGLHDNYENIGQEIISAAPVAVKTLVIRGSRSGYVTDEDMASFQQLFNDVELATLSSGHWVHAEAPQEFLETVRGFIS